MPRKKCKLLYSARRATREADGDCPSETCWEWNEATQACDLKGEIVFKKILDVLLEFNIAEIVGKDVVHTPCSHPLGLQISYF